LGYNDGPGDIERIMAEPDLKTRRVGVLMGGLSREREISLLSGGNCLAALVRLGYDAVAVDVGRDISEVLGRKGIEVAFLALHGRYGEDGCIQGLLEVLDIPYTGSRVMASSLAMNKKISKELVTYHGIPTPAFATFICYQDLEQACRDAAGKLRFPVMVKPCEEGSSLGVAKVDRQEDLLGVVSAACRDYEVVLAEEFIAGDEVTVGLLERESGLVALPVLQLVPKKGFYDFEAKYQQGMTEFVLPADIDGATADRCRELALSVHRIIGCRGFSRVDFMIDSAGEPQFTEINTLPGMTDTSDLPAQAAAAGIGYDELVETMLESALLP
jgi:D-alanine-D-alanine ligase